MHFGLSELRKGGRSQTINERNICERVLGITCKRCKYQLPNVFG